MLMNDLQRSFFLSYALDSNYCPLSLVSDCLSFLFTALCIARFVRNTVSIAFFIYAFS